MARKDDILQPPSDLPVPADDGMARHLIGMPVAKVSLRSTWGQWVDLSTLAGRTVVYRYPRTGRPGVEPLDGWDLIPGARGCTPQACAFRDHHRELEAHDARVFGLSSQDTNYQLEAAERLHLPFPLLSDAQFAFASAMRLPQFEAGSMRLLKRLTLIVRDGLVEHVFYPVFPPDRNAEQVLDWLRSHREQSGR
jgi:peroxiredoxin